FDETHAFKSNGVYALPFGEGHRLNVADNGLSRLISGWSISSNVTWQAGAPFSILSTRGTLNRTARSSTVNTADSLVSSDQVGKLIGLHMTSTGPLFIDPSAINTDGRGVNADGTPTFSGQVFSNPAPGTIGGMQRRMFNGPSVFNMDFAILKMTKI